MFLRDDDASVLTRSQTVPQTHSQTVPTGDLSLCGFTAAVSTCFIADKAVNMVIVMRHQVDGPRRLAPTVSIGGAPAYDEDGYSSSTRPSACMLSRSLASGGLAQ